MDMGTTNTRVFLADGNRVIGKKKGAFGAGSTKRNGRGFLLDSVRNLFFELCIENGSSLSDIDEIIVSGMAGSEIGLLDVPHMPIPASVKDMAKNTLKTNVKEICEAPFVFVRGLKKTEGDMLCDIMRGEETETVGILSAQNRGDAAVIVLPGTHNKIISVDENGIITDFYTTFSGELLSGIVSNSILTGQVSYDFEICESEVRRGAEYTKENGLNAAIFHVRVDSKNGRSVDELSSFLVGAVIAEDIPLIKRVAKNKKIFVGGRESLRRIYTMLIGENAYELEDEVSENAVMRGLMEIRSYINENKV